VQAYILFLEHAPRQAWERIAQLEQRVNELEARLNRHSGNSSQPPSQDPPQAPGNRKEKSGRKPGGQKGHQGNYRELMPPEKVNKIVEHRAKECPRCRSALHRGGPGRLLPWNGARSGNCLKFNDIVEYVVAAIQAHRTGQLAPSLLPGNPLFAEAA
jgi:hypothetical protein